MENVFQSEVTDEAIGEIRPPLGLTLIYFGLIVHLLKFFFLPGQYSSLYSFLLHPGETMTWFLNQPMGLIHLHLIGSVQDIIFLVLALTLSVLYGRRSAVFRPIYVTYLILNALFSLLVALCATIAPVPGEPPNLDFLWSLCATHTLALAILWAYLYSAAPSTYFEHLETVESGGAPAGAFFRVRPVTLLVGAGLVGPQWLLSLALVAVLLTLAAAVIREKHRSIPQLLIETGLCFFWLVVLPRLH